MFVSLDDQENTAMRKLALILALSVLGGCAYPPPGPPNYGTRAYTGDPSQWHTVSVTPVAPGTGAQAAAAAGVSPGAGNTASDPAVQTTQAPYAASQPVYVPQPVYVQQPVYVSPPVYVQQPVYVPQPAYSYDPYYWWPPISIGLGFSWFHGDGGHGHGWGGHGGNWGGHGGGWGGHGGGGHRGH
jgi:hypothetical protein